jgi:hypothetical protein
LQQARPAGRVCRGGVRDAGSRGSAGRERVCSGTKFGFVHGTSDTGSGAERFDDRALSLTVPAETGSSTSANADSRPKYLDDAPPPPVAEQPNVHGFFSSPFKTAYVTPRGLVVENQGLVWQPVLGLVFPIGDLGIFKNFTLVGGIWNSINTNQADPHVGSWNEMDVFVSVSATVANNFSLTLTYSPWNSPPHAFITEHTADLKIAFNDSSMWGTSGISLNPYVDLFVSIAGDSTVILGRRGGTGYVEPGIVPTYTVKAIPNYPVTLTFPTYIQIGPPGYWDATGAFSNSSFGVFSISANATVPLSFIPARYGHWHADIGVTYDYLINNALLHAGEIASGNDNHNVLIGSAGFGVNF